MALHDELAALRAAVGDQAFDDPATFRAAFDDFVPEGSASTGEVSLLVGAIATGALQRLREQLALGADAETAIAVQGELLARDRGTTESEGARWALSVLAHAVGAVQADRVPTRPEVTDSRDVPARPAVATTEPVGPAPTGPATGSDAPRRERRGTNPLLVGAVVALVVVAVTAAALVLLRDGDPATTTAEDDVSAETSGSTSEEVLAQSEVTASGETMRIQLVHEGTDAHLVLLAQRDGEWVEVDRVPTSCPWLGTSYDAGIEPQPRNQIFWGWQERGNESYGEYGAVDVDEEMLVPFGVGERACPSEH